MQTRNFLSFNNIFFKVSKFPWKNNQLLVIICWSKKSRVALMRHSLSFLYLWKLFWKTVIECPASISFCRWMKPNKRNKYFCSTATIYQKKQGKIPLQRFNRVIPRFKCQFSSLPEEGLVTRRGITRLNNT